MTGAFLGPLVAKRTYRRLAFLLSAVPLAPLWFGLLLGGWLLAGLTAVLPLLVPVLIGFRTLTWLAAGVEAALARALLDVDVQAARPLPGQKGYWGRIRGTLADPGLWKQQTYLFVRMLVGGALAIGIATALAVALGLLATPIAYRFDDQEIGSWHVDTLSRAFLLFAGGVLALLVWPQLVRVFAAPWPSLVRGLVDDPVGRGSPPPDFGRVLRVALWFHAGLFAALNALLAIVWAVTAHTAFWPVWPLLGLGLPLAVHAWLVLVDEREPLCRAGRALAIESGVAAALAGFCIGVWGASGHGTFWPVWPILAFCIVLAAHAIVVAVARLGRGTLAERIDVLTSTRAGAVDVAENELRRIERDLHDGAQARLVALGMSLGMAEQKLASDPEAAGRLLAEARVGAGAALKELRDLARGIHPPILADRGLEAALTALAAGTPLAVDVRVDVGERPAAPVETAVYFVVAEALANAAKHAQATHVEIRVARREGLLSVSVGDDGRGGAESAGPGLTGIRRRVEALDGTFAVESPPGGPTTVRAVLPCAS
jgi:signal transduction histidine kinase